MKITKVHIEKFRGFQNEDFELGSQLTAIAGQNGTQKSTLLGIITQTFTIKTGGPMSSEKPLCGGSYRSQFSDKFRLSPVFDQPRGHEWTLFFEDDTNFTVESISRNGESIRFWQKGARKAGDGYLSFPTIFLSLKRLLPTAEESKVSTDSNVLSQEEIEEFKRLHNQILITQTPVSSATAITSKNKQSIGVTTDYYDWNQNSMGQDNLGKVILALFSFQRLKEKFPDDYHGGILAIDELDATMYPASQEELLKVLRKYASRLNLQIIFTTHSLSLLKSVDNLRSVTNLREETSGQVKILYLKKVDKNIKIFHDVLYEDIMLNLQVAAKSNNRNKRKITVYCEDEETKVFAKSLLGRKASALKFVDATFSCSALIEWVSKKVPAFIRPLSVVVLDGDIRNNKANMRKLNNADNVLILPGTESPERLLASLLNSLSDEDPLWSTIANGYSAQVCFRNIKPDEIISNGENSRQKAKEWFNEQSKNYWGMKRNSILKRLFATMDEESKAFVSDFDEMIAKFIHD